MFTGIVEELGSIEAVEPKGDSLRITVGATEVLSDLKIGDSISLDGTCLTAVGLTAQSFTVEAVSETLLRTTLGGLESGDRVNLERPLRLSDRLGGHLLQGHVDSVVRILSKEKRDKGTEVKFELPADLGRYFVEKGSVGVDGVSLTIAGLSSNWFSVALIPHTEAATTLGEKEAGSTVNLEVDLIGKYVERLLNREREHLEVDGPITAQWLREKGY